MPHPAPFQLGLRLGVSAVGVCVMVWCSMCCTVFYYYLYFFPLMLPCSLSFSLFQHFCVFVCLYIHTYYFFHMTELRYVVTNLIIP